jgi:hypothetical protein
MGTCPRCGRPMDEVSPLGEFTRYLAVIVLIMNLIAIMVAGVISQLLWLTIPFVVVVGILGVSRILRDSGPPHYVCRYCLPRDLLQ